MAEAGFDPAAEFLLDRPWHNLFETTGDALVARCKGCRAVVKVGEREAHYNRHRGIRKRSENARKKRIKREKTERLAKARRAKAAGA